jgi:glycosyltransferase involved in cell wall biosynthesis
VASHTAVPLVSLIIPSFNHERFIVQCLDSILANDYPNKEILVLDDGSTDGTLGLAQDWAARHGNGLRISVKWQANRGVTPTLNELLAAAEGELVLPIASDDFLLPGGISTLVEALEAKPSANAVFGDCVVVDETGEIIHGSSLFGYRTANRSRLMHRLTDELITNWVLAGPALIYRRDPIRSIGGYDEDLFVEDWDFYLRLARRNWLVFIDRKVAAYRLHGRNEHLNTATLTRRAREQRRVALSAARAFGPRRRLLLRMMALSYAAPLVGLRNRTPLNVVRFGLRSSVRLLARLLAGIG